MPVVTGQTKIVDYPEVKEVADKLGATPAQVLVAWGAYRGYSVIPKSVQESAWTISLHSVSGGENGAHMDLDRPHQV